MNMEQERTATEECLLLEADTLGELLEKIKDRISPALIDDRGWERLLERACELPASLAAFPFGFELPLHKIQPGADFGISLIGGSRSATLFEQWQQAKESDSTVPGVTWLLNETEPEESPLRRIAGRKFLIEYDVDSTPTGTHQHPGIFLYPEGQTLVGDGQRLNDLGVATDAITYAAGWVFDSAERRQVERVYSVMKSDTRIGAIGAFPSRRRGIRLAVTGFTKTRDVLAFLERAGWTGEQSIVSSTASHFEERHAFAYMGIHFDVHSDGIGPTLGLSFFAQKGEWQISVRNWKTLFDCIREQRLAVPEKLSELANSWAGTETLFGKSGIFVLVRGIHHIKLGLIENRVEQVKAYPYLLLMRSRLLGEDSSD